MLLSYAVQLIAARLNLHLICNLFETEYKQFFKYIIIICPTWRYNQTYLKRKWLFNDPQHVFLVDPKELFSKSKDPLNDTLKVFFESIGKLDKSQVLFLVNDCSEEKGMKKKSIKCFLN